MRLYLPVQLLGITLGIASICGANPSAPRLVRPSSPEITISAENMQTLLKDLGRSGFHKGDVSAQGLPGKPVSLQSPDAQVRANNILVDARTRRFLATAGSKPVTVKGRIVPQSGGLPLSFEVTCGEAGFDPESGVWTLADNVKGFYETAKGRKPLGGDEVTLSRLKSTVAIKQTTTQNAGGNQ